MACAALRHRACGLTLQDWQRHIPYAIWLSVRGYVSQNPDKSIYLLRVADVSVETHRVGFHYGPARV